jgi:hypothetical protein
MLVLLTMAGMRHGWVVVPYCGMQAQLSNRRDVRSPSRGGTWFFVVLRGSSWFFVVLRGSSSVFLGGVCLSRFSVNLSSKCSSHLRTDKRRRNTAQLPTLPSSSGELARHFVQFDSLFPLVLSTVERFNRRMAVCVTLLSPVMHGTLGCTLKLQNNCGNPTPYPLSQLQSGRLIHWRPCRL